MKDYMTIEEDKIKHHNFMEIDGKMLHLISDGNSRYGHWLMSEEEIRLEKEWEDKIDSNEEWNKFSMKTARDADAAYEDGLKDKLSGIYNKNYGLDKCGKYKYSAEQRQKYYDAGYKEIDKKEVEKITVIHCDFCEKTLMNYYENHPFVSYIREKESRPMTYRRAIKERGSKEKAQEFIEFYNNKE